MEAIILAGGKGTRLQSIVSEVPKVLATVGGKPFLDYLLKWLEYNGITRVVISTGYKSDLIKSNYGAKFRTLDIEYCNEDSPLGTGGAIKKALQLCRGESIFVLNGDSFFGVDLSMMHTAHTDVKADVTIAVKEMRNYSRYGTIVFSDGVVSFREKQHTEHGHINCGVYIVGRDVFHRFCMPKVFSFENDFLGKNEAKINVIPSEGNFIDIGVPEDYELAQSSIPQWLTL